MGVAQERAAMCWACTGCGLASRFGGAHGAALTCRGVPLVRRIETGRCPRMKFPDDAGRTRWLGLRGLSLRWHGVPMPVRVSLRLFNPGRPRASAWPGCGCLVAGKAAWLRVRAAAFGVVARACSATRPGVAVPIGRGSGAKR
ncbi:MAG: hypothetical protein AAGF47_03815 [Planctomycetota bacterium]